MNLFKNNMDVKCETAGSAGFDIRAVGSTSIRPGETKLIHTDLYLEDNLPSDYYLAIHSRSGLALKNGVFVLNAPGLVDLDYKGEVGIILHNAGSELFTVKHRDRIAQGVVLKHHTHDFVPTSDAVRGEGGFGSTGV